MTRLDEDFRKLAFGFVCFWQYLLEAAVLA